MANLAARSSLGHQRRSSFLYGQPSFNILTNNFVQQIPNMISTSFHAILAFIAPILVTFIEVKFQGKANSPFETHPITTMIAITSLLAYSLSYGAELKFSSVVHPSRTHLHVSVCRGIMTFFGSLSLASLASMLLPDSLCFVLYVIYTLLVLVLFLGELGDVVRKVWQSFHQKGPLLPLTSRDAQ